MKTIKNIFGVMYYYFFKLNHSDNFKSKKLCLFFKKSNVIIEEKGSIHLDGRVTLGEYSELRAIGKIKLGENVYINKFSRIVSHDSIEIGNNVLIAQFVSILDHDHHYFYNEQSIQFEGYNTAPIRIGNNVLIGDKVTILKGTVIGDNVIIGAHSLVKGIIPDNSLVVCSLSNTKMSSLNSDLS